MIVEHEKERSRRRRRDATNHSTREFYNLSGDMFDVDYPEAEKLVLYDEKDETSTEYNDTVMEEFPVDENLEDLGYFGGPLWQRNRIPSERSCCLFSF